MLCYLQGGRSPNKRGVSIQIGPDVTKNFLRRNNLSKSIHIVIPILSARSHCLFETVHGKTRCKMNVSILWLVNTKVDGSGIQWDEQKEKKGENPGKSSICY